MSAATAIPWREIFGLLTGLMMRPAGVVFVMGGFAVTAGVIVLHTSPI
jgi:hypothetical protein